MTDDAAAADSTDDSANDQVDRIPGQAEAEELLTAVLPFAEQHLSENGGFTPFAAALTDDDEIVFVEGEPDDEDDESEDEDEDDEDPRLEQLRLAMRAGAQRGDYLATAIAFDATITTAESEEDENEEETDAIAVDLDTIAGFTALAFLPYAIADDGEISVGEMIAQEGEHDIFG